MSGGHAAARARKVGVGMEAYILLTHALFWRASIFFIIKTTHRGIFWAHLEHPQANKKQTEPKRARACTLGHFHERAGETLEHKLRLGFGPTPKSLFVSEIRTLEVAQRSKSKFTL